jgi:hypothetical protein
MSGQAALQPAVPPPNSNNDGAAATFVPQVTTPQPAPGVAVAPPPAPRPQFDVSGQFGTTNGGNDDGGGSELMPLLVTLGVFVLVVSIFFAVLERRRRSRRGNDRYWPCESLFLSLYFPLCYCAFARRCPWLTIVSLIPDYLLLQIWTARAPRTASGASACSTARRSCRSAGARVCARPS